MADLSLLVERAMDSLDFSNVKRIAIDETSARKGHDYVTLFVDMDTKRVLFAIEGNLISQMSLVLPLMKPQADVVIIMFRYLLMQTPNVSFSPLKVKMPL